MTLILARFSTQEMLCDDSLDWGDNLRFRSFHKVVPAWGGLLGGAGNAGAVHKMLMESASINIESMACEAMANYIADKDDWQVEGLFLSPQGIYLLDATGSVDRVERDWCAIGSGAPAAMAIMEYTDGQANLQDVLEAVAEVIPSVSNRGKVWRI